MTRHVALVLKDDKEGYGEQAKGFRWWLMTTVLYWWK